MVEENEKAECSDCENGHTPAGWALRKIAQLIMIAGKDGGNSRSPHPWLKSVGINLLSPDMAALSSALAGRSATRSGGHDGIDAWEATRKIVAAAGLPSSWGLCKTCGGSGEIEHRPDRNEDEHDGT